MSSEDDRTPPERDATAPEQPLTENQPDGEQHVFLPGLLSDEFGIARSQARMEILTGTVEIDGDAYNGDPLDIPRSLVAGKTIEVKGGQSRTFRVQIDA